MAAAEESVWQLSRQGICADELKIYLLQKSGKAALLQRL